MVVESWVFICILCCKGIVTSIYVSYVKIVLNLNSVFTLAVSGTGTDIIQKPFKLAMSEARTGHLKSH